MTPLSPTTAYVPTNENKVIFKPHDDVRLLADECGESIVVNKPKGPGGVIYNWTTVKETSGYLFTREELELLLTKVFFAGSDHGVDKYHKQDHETNKFPSCTSLIKQILP